MEATPPKNREPIKSPTHYVLLIDEDRQKVLSAILGAAVLNGQILVSFLRKEGVEKGFETLTSDIATAMHERGWCKIPNCGHGNHLTT